MAIGRRAQNHQHKFTFSALGLSGGGREREMFGEWVLKLIKRSAAFGHKIDSLWPGN